MQTEATPAQADVSELDLVRRCQAGDTEAFDELVTRYRTRVFGMIYNMVHSEQDAWDLAQDSFLKAWKSIKRFRGRSSFYTWIYRIVMNVTIDWLRKKQIKGAGTEFDDAIQLRQVDPASKTVPKTEALPYETMERDEIRVRIDKAIAQLPETRQAFEAGARRSNDDERRVFQSSTSRANRAGRWGNLSGTRRPPHRTLHVVDDPSSLVDWHCIACCLFSLYGSRHAREKSD